MSMLVQNVPNGCFSILLTVVDGRESEIAVNWFDWEFPRVHHNMIFSEHVHVRN